MAPCSEDFAVGSPVPFHRLGTPVSIPANGSIARISVSPRLSRDVRAVLGSVPFDIIHLHEPMLPSLPLAVLRASRATNVGTFHAYRGSNFAYFYGKPFLRYFFGKLDGRIAVSPCARDFVARHFPAPYRVIPNGIDYDRFARPLAPIRELCDGRPNVLFVGRLEKRKGLSYLLRAWARVHDAVPQARLVVVGGGGGLQHYRKFVEERLSDDIVFTGQVSDEELPRYYQTADVYCAPSTGGESFGIVLLEAMAAARPIVTTSIAGYRDVVTHDREGLLVPPKDAGALADALVRVLRDRALQARLGETGRRTAVKYDWRQVADDVLEYYRETAHRRSLLRAVRRPRFRRVRRVASGVAHLLSH
jgi:phosphatidylinositol alpha-mannosyltransferase